MFGHGKRIDQLERDTRSIKASLEEKLIKVDEAAWNSIRPLKDGITRHSEMLGAATLNIRQLKGRIDKQQRDIGELQDLAVSLEKRIKTLEARAGLAIFSGSKTSKGKSPS